MGVAEISSFGCAPASRVVGAGVGSRRGLGSTNKKVEKKMKKKYTKLFIVRGAPSQHGGAFFPGPVQVGTSTQLLLFYLVS